MNPGRAETIDSARRDWCGEVTNYRDTNGHRVAAVRCGECKGKGCALCGGVGFVAQVTP